MVFFMAYSGINILNLVEVLKAIARSNSDVV